MLFVLQVLEANLNGEMNLKIDTDLVSVTTHFKELGNPPWGERRSEHLMLLHSHSTELNTCSPELREKTKLSYQVPLMHLDRGFIFLLKMRGQD